MVRDYNTGQIDINIRKHRVHSSDEDMKSVTFSVSSSLHLLNESESRQYVLQLDDGCIPST